MGSDHRRPRKTTKSSPSSRHPKPTSIAVILSPTHTVLSAPYDTTSHALQHTSHSTPSPLFAITPANNMPHYTQTTQSQQTTDLTPMERFELPSPFPYHQHTTYTPPTSSPYKSTTRHSAVSSSQYPVSTSYTGTYTNTYHTPNSQHAPSRDYSTQAQAGSYSEDIYPQTQHQDVYSTPEPQYYSSTDTGYDVTWKRDDLSGVGEHFEYADQAAYHYGNTEIDL